MTSIDKDEVSCRQLKECLVNEHNLNTVEILFNDVLKINDRDNLYDIVTVVGSTRMESELYDDMLLKAYQFIKPEGKLYYVTLDNKKQ